MNKILKNILNEYIQVKMMACTVERSRKWHPLHQKTTIPLEYGNKCHNARIIFFRGLISEAVT